MSQVNRTEGLVGNTAIKAPVKAATTANITLSGEQTIDGIACVTGDRVLVKDQTNTVNNGIYVVDTGEWSRSQDFDGSLDIVTGSIITVNYGTLKARSLWRVTTVDPITIGSSALTFDENIASATDSSNITYVPAGTGAVATTVQTVLRRRKYIEDFRVVGDTDDQVIQKAMTYAATWAPWGITFEFQPKTYNTLVPMTLASNGIRIRGEGALLNADFTGGAIIFSPVSNVYPVEVEIENIDITVNSGVSSAGIILRTSYSYYRNVSVLLKTASTNAKGFTLVGDETYGTGPYYNTFIGCNVQSQSASTDHTGVFCSTAAALYRGPNANLWMGGRIGQCATGFSITGNGNRFLGSTVENAAGLGVAYDFVGPVALKVSQNVVDSLYIENASIGFRFSAFTNGNTVYTGYSTGVTTLVSDAGVDNQTLGTTNPCTFPTGIKVNGSTLSSNANVLDYYEEGTWTAVISGAGTAGTYEIATNNCKYTRIGRQVFLEGYIALAGAITGGGTSYLKISGLPFAKIASSGPRGSVLTSGVDLTAGAINLTVGFESNAASSVLVLEETIDNAASTVVPISAVAASDYFSLSISYNV